MYSQFALATQHGFDSHQLNYQKCIITGNWLMLISVVIMSVCILLTYVIDQHISIPIQVAAHMGTIVLAGTLKVGYVIRCVGVHGLGYKVI